MQLQNCNDILFSAAKPRTNSSPFNLEASKKRRGNLSAGDIS
jgi:hypothetical protein